MKLNNRRYIGSKIKLLDEIYKAVTDANIDINSFADIFAGTGVVANKFANIYDIIINDTLFHNIVLYRAWFLKEKVDLNTYKKYLLEFNQIDPRKIKNNYFSKIYSDKYFHKNDAKKIGEIRERIELIKPKITERMYYLLLSSLILYADKIANTVGHFEHYLSSSPKITKSKLEELDINIFQKNINIYREDANELVKHIKADAIYIDPPYNARQYINFYHVLENLANWDKPQEFEGSSMKFKRNHLKSKYSTSKAPEIFKDLINNCNAKLIVVSYNNTYTATSSASNNKITYEQLVSILKKKGELTIKEINFNYFNTGKTNFKKQVGS